MNENKFSLVDVSHVVEEGMITYKGLPAPLICDFLSREASKKLYAAGTSFHIGKIEMVANTGTYVDSPFHRFAEGKDLSELELTSLAGVEGLVFKTTEAQHVIGPELFDGADVKGKAVLIQTGWDQYWKTDQYFEGHPFLSAQCAAFLRSEGAAIVGIDSYNIDDITDDARPVHTTLLGAGIPIVEHMCNLSALPRSGFTFYAVPVKIKGMGTFPVRAFGRVPG